MHLYNANPTVLHRARDLARQLGAEITDFGPEDVEMIAEASTALAAMFEFELAMWSDPDNRLDHDELATTTTELSASWVCLGMLTFLSLATLLEGSVQESWPDKAAAWREHGFEVAATLGATTGDYAVAGEYLRHYTEELLNS